MAGYIAADLRDVMSSANFNEHKATRKPKYE